jgi:hypothetical protein
MATTGDAPLNLTKPEASDVVSLSVINTNYDTINAKAAAVDSTLATHTSQISSLNTATGAGGAVVKATNIAGGTAKRIPIQSSANNTTFIPESEVGKLLIGTSTPPYAGWAHPVPYKVQSGIIQSGSAGGWDDGLKSVDFTVPFTENPIVVLTPFGTSPTVSQIVTLSAVNTNAFQVRARQITVSGTTPFAAVANGSPTVHWVAIQYSPTSASS